MRCGWWLSHGLWRSNLICQAVTTIPLADQEVRQAWLRAAQRETAAFTEFLIGKLAAGRG